MNISHLVSCVTYVIFFEKNFFKCQIQTVVHDNTAENAPENGIGRK